MGGPWHSSHASAASGRALLCPLWSCVHSSAAVLGSGSSKPGPVRPEQRVGGLCADGGRLSAVVSACWLAALPCALSLPEHRWGRWRLGEARRTLTWLWASLVCPWVTLRSFLVTAFLEGNPSCSRPALSPVVPPASAVSSLFDSSEVLCPRFLLGQQALGSHPVW